MADGVQHRGVADARRRGFRAGALASIPIMPATFPFGLIFGAIAAESGLDWTQAMAMAALVVAAASQLAALQLLGEHAPVAVIIATGAAINLRLAMYSASLVPHLQGSSLLERALVSTMLHDQAYAVSINRFRGRAEGPVERIAFFLGAAVPSSAVWLLATLIGVSLGAALPEGLDFFVPLAFLALVAPMLRGRPSLAAAAVSVAVAVVLHDMAYRSGLFVASAAGIAVGTLLSGGRDG